MEGIRLMDRLVPPQSCPGRLERSKGGRTRLWRGLHRTLRGGRLTRQGQDIVIGDDATYGSQNLLHGGFMGSLVGCRLLVRG